MEFDWRHLFPSHTLCLLSQHREGYELFQLIPNGMARRDFENAPSAPFMFSSFVFLRSDQIGRSTNDGLQF
jgi:hypothetical protein